MADISKLTLNGTSYNIKDGTARSWASSALSLISTIQQVGVNYSVASSLPTAGEDYKGWIYLIPDPFGSGSDVKKEYICVQNGTSWSWEQIGTTATDLKNYISGTLTAITVPSASHSHKYDLPLIEAISYTPAGSIDLGLTTGANSSTASVTQSAVNISLTGSYTPAGTIAIDSTAGTTSVEATLSGQYDKTTGATFTQTATAATVTNTATVADVTGATYTPQGTLSTSNATATGRIAYVASITGLVGQKLYGNPTISTSTKASALTSATLQYTYDSTNENLTIGSGTSTVGLSTATSNCFTAFTIAQGEALDGTAPVATASYMSFVGTEATITPGVTYSKATAVSYSKTTGITYTYTSTTFNASGNVDIPAYKFTGTAGTVTTSGTYSKVSAVKYDKLTFSPAFTGSATTLNPSYGSVMLEKDTGIATTGASGTITGVSGVTQGTT